MENKSSELSIRLNSVVSMRYVMSNESGDVLEDNMNSAPVQYLHGGTRIEPLLQEQLAGLKAGSEKRLFLSAASGLTSQDYFFDVTIDHVREATAPEIKLGYPVQVDVVFCGEDCDCHKIDEAFQ